MAYAIIPARGGSRRIPGKNKKAFHGKPIISYSIEAAQESGLFDEVFVSTDDKEIEWIAHDCRASVLMRDPALCADEVGTQEVAREVLKGLGVEDGFACVIYPCAPMIDIGRLKKGQEAIIRGPYSYAYSVDENLFDAGQWYWGMVAAFLNDVPLAESFKIIVPNAIDINTAADWTRAEEMYAKLHEVKA